MASIKYIKDNQTKESIYPITKSECIVDAFSISNEEIDALFMPASIYVPTQSLALLIGDQYEIITNIYTDSPIKINDLVWTSSNPAIASVDQGVVTAISEGSCDITVSSDFYNTNIVISTSVSKPIVFEAIDLGLSSGLKWASFNLGAAAPEQYGDYYSWGETSVKDSYESSDYTLYDADGSMIKYNESDSLTTLMPEDDAATVNLGEQWRMPTKDEFIELIEECSVQDHTINNILGLLLTGPNGNSIFLPHTGAWDPENTTDTVFDSGYYWTSSIEGSSAIEIHTETGNISQQSDPGYYGQSIRPVTNQ